MAEQSAPTSADWRQRVFVVQSIVLLVVVAIAIGVTVARSSVTSVNAKVDNVQGSLLPMDHGCTSDGTTTLCNKRPTPTPTTSSATASNPPSPSASAPASPSRCVKNPTAFSCLKNGAQCPASVSGMVAQNEHSVEFECRDHIWRRVQKPVTSGES